MTTYTDGPLEPEDEAAPEGPQDPTLSEPAPANEGGDKPATDEPAE